MQSPDPSVLTGSKVTDGFKAKVDICFNLLDP